jgi:hypothetical protein
MYSGSDFSTVIVSNSLRDIGDSQQKNFNLPFGELDLDLERDE